MAEPFELGTRVRLRAHPSIGGHVLSGGVARTLVDHGRGKRDEYHDTDKLEAIPSGSTWCGHCSRDAILTIVDEPLRMPLCADCSSGILEAPEAPEALKEQIRQKLAEV